MIAERDTKPCEFILPDNKPCGDPVSGPHNPNRRVLCTFHFRVALRLAEEKRR